MSTSATRSTAAQPTARHSGGERHDQIPTGRGDPTATSDTDLSSQAQHQVGDYYLGFNGLANRGPDDGPQVPVRTWKEYQRRL